MTKINQPIENDSFLNLLDELRDELEAINTENVNPIDDDIDQAVANIENIVNTIAADFVNKHNENSSGFTHISQALPTNTLNNDVLYVGINSKGFACVFNYLSVIKTTPQHQNFYTCHYINGEETQQQMNGLVWWKILQLPTYKDFFDHGFAAQSASFISKKTIEDNPYQKGTPEHHHWRNGWIFADELPF